MSQVILHHHMEPLRKGRYVARLARTERDVRAAQRLRWLCFVARTGAPDDGRRLDIDDFDDRCRHVLIEDAASERLVCCFRCLPLETGHQISASYSAQFYDLRALANFDGPMLEIGRFCVHPAVSEPDIIRTAWAALTRLVDQAGVQMLFGCSSFRGTDPCDHADAFALLNARHRAPHRWSPRIKAPEVVRLACTLPSGPPDLRRAMADMPPLLRSYLVLGGWVGDHAVVDRVLQTMHVFTGLEIRNIPPARQRLLRNSARPGQFSSAQA